MRQKSNGKQQFVIKRAAGFLLLIFVFTGIIGICVEKKDNRIRADSGMETERMAEENTKAASGKIKEEELETHPMKHMLIRAVGVEKTVEADDFFLPYTDGMKILLCSDGLHGFCTEEEMQEILQQEKPAQELADELLKLALEKGGTDNIAIAIITD